MASVLVTGGSGFIGSHLVDQLIADGHDTKIYDLEAPRHGQSCEFVRGDILDQQRLSKATKGVDYIYNLAAEANINRFIDGPLHSSLTTSHGLLTVLEVALENSVQRVIQASTEWVYGTGGGEGEIVTEETPYSQRPDHLYTSSKIAAELFMVNYCDLFEQDFTIMRFGIPFGERARAATVAPIFIGKILRNEEITIHGDGSQTRQFLYVRDLAAGIVACLSDSARNEVFNLNGAKPISVLEIVSTIEGILNMRAKVRFIEDRSGNFGGCFVSSEKAKRILGWQPEFSYEDAMSRYVQRFAENERAMNG